MTQTSQDPDLPLVLMIAGFLAMVFAALILIGQAGIWLRYGAWPEFCLADFWRPAGWQLPQNSGVIKVIIWLLRCPLCSELFSLGLILGAIGMSLGSRTSVSAPKSN